MMEWSACLDQIVGVYDAAYTRGSSALPGASSILKRTGFGKVFAARRRRRGWRRTAAPRPNAAVSVSVAASRRPRRVQFLRRRVPLHRRARAQTRRMARRRRFSLARARTLAEDPCDGTVDLVHGWDHDRVRVVRRRVSRSRAAAFSANPDARWTRFPRFVSLNRSRRGTSATSRLSPRRASNSPTSRRISDNSPSRPTPSRRSCTGRVPARRGRGRGPRCSRRRRRVRDATGIGSVEVGVRARRRRRTSREPRRADVHRDRGDL